MRKNSARGAVIAAIHASAASGALASVIASTELSVNKNLELAGFECADCSTHFGAIASLTPFCITCGSEDVAPLEDGEFSDAQPEQLDDEDQLTAVTCAVCSTHNIMRDSMVAALGGHAHCVQCGADLPYVIPEADDGALPTVDPLDIDDVAAGIDGNNTPEANRTGALPAGGVDNNTSESNRDGLPAGGVDNNTAESNGDVITVSLDDLDGEPSADDDFQVMQTSEDSCMAFVNGMPMARSTRETSKAGANFATAAWVRAIKHTHSDQGRKATFAAFGFKPLTVSVKVPSVVQAKVDTALASQRIAVEASAKDVRADFEQCLAVALAGINKGFWRNTENALKAGFYDEMQAAGVTKPSVLIDRVFATSGRSFLQTVMAKAQELSTLNLSVRNELAHQVEASNYMNASEQTGDDDELSTSDMDVTARLRGQGVRTQAVANITTGTPLRAALAGKKLFN